MGVDFLHPLCYQKSGTTHKIFGHTDKSELFDTTRALAVKTSDGIRYFNAVDVSATQPVFDSTGLQLSSLRDFKTTKNNIYSNVASVELVIEVRNTGVIMKTVTSSLMVRSNASFLQRLLIKGTVGASAIDISVSGPGTTVLGLNSATGASVSVLYNLTLELEGTPYKITMTGQTPSMSSGTYSVAGIVTDSVSP